METRQGEGEWSLPRPSVAQVFAVDRAGDRWAPDASGGGAQ